MVMVDDDVCILSGPLDNILKCTMTLYSFLYDIKRQVIIVIIKEKGI